MSMTKQLAKAIQEHREALGYSIDEAASLASMPVDHYQRIEAGKCITLGDLEALIPALSLGEIVAKFDVRENCCSIENRLY